MTIAIITWDDIRSVNLQVILSEIQTYGGVSTPNLYDTLDKDKVFQMFEEMKPKKSLWRKFREWVS